MGPGYCLFHKGAWGGSLWCGYGPGRNQFRKAAWWVSGPISMATKLQVLKVWFCFRMWELLIIGHFSFLCSSLEWSPFICCWDYLLRFSFWTPISPTLLCFTLKTHTQHSFTHSLTPTCTHTHTHTHSHTLVHSQLLTYIHSLTHIYVLNICYIYTYMYYWNKTEHGGSERERGLCYILLFVLAVVMATKSLIIDLQ
jgi:hypothetical protein